MVMAEWSMEQLMISLRRWGCKMYPSFLFPSQFSFGYWLACSTEGLPGLFFFTNDKSIYFSYLSCGVLEFSPFWPNKFIISRSKCTFIFHGVLIFRPLKTYKHFKRFLKM
jgi:hypothetical protein